MPPNGSRGRLAMSTHGQLGSILVASRGKGEARIERMKMYVEHGVRHGLGLRHLCSAALDELLEYHGLISVVECSSWYVRATCGVDGMESGVPSIDPMGQRGFINEQRASLDLGPSRPPRRKPTNQPNPGQSRSMLGMGRSSL